MREIKFRVWDGERLWHTASLSVTESFNSVAAHEEDDLDGFIDDWLGRADCYIMQFTGLHDSEGTDIYEGDVVEWEGISITVESEKGAFWLGPEILLHRIGCRVVGNIYEDKHLVE